MEEGDAHDEDGDLSRANDSTARVDPADDRPLHELVDPPYSSSDDEDKFITIDFSGKADERKKQAKPKTRSGRPIVGPLFENFDLGVASGEWVDITPLEPIPGYGRIERAVLKKVLRPGTGACPQSGTIIKVKHHQLVWLQSDRRIVLDTTRHPLHPEGMKPEEWTFGQGMQIAGIEAGIFTMRAGEKARFKIDWRYAYGERGIVPGPPLIPPKSDVYVDETMYEWRPSVKERCAMSSAEIFEEAKRVREEGNYLFKEGKWAEANYVYDDVFNCIKLMVRKCCVCIMSILIRYHNIPLQYHEYLQTEWITIRKLEAETLNNQAMCYVRMGDYEMGERRARKCLEILPENLKALYRLGLCCNERGNAKDGKMFLKYAICLKPDCLTVREEYNRACRSLRDELTATNKTWKGAFNRTNRLGDKEEAAKLKETSEIAKRLDEWDRQKKEQHQRLLNRKTAAKSSAQDTAFAPQGLAISASARRAVDKMNAPSTVHEMVAAHALGATRVPKRSSEEVRVNVHILQSFKRKSLHLYFFDGIGGL